MVRFSRAPDHPQHHPGGRGRLVIRNAEDQVFCSRICLLRSFPGEGGVHHNLRSTGLYSMSFRGLHPLWAYLTEKARVAAGGGRSWNQLAHFSSFEAWPLGASAPAAQGQTLAETKPYKLSPKEDFFQQGSCPPASVSVTLNRCMFLQSGEILKWRPLG